MCKGFKCPTRRMRRNCHISLQGEWSLCVLAVPGINSSRDLRCVVYWWIFMQLQSQGADQQGPKLCPILSLFCPLPSIKLQVHPEVERRRERICLVREERRGLISEIKDKFLTFKYFSSLRNCRALQQGERVNVNTATNSNLTNLYQIREHTHTHAQTSLLLKPI